MNFDHEILSRLPAEARAVLKFREEEERTEDENYEQRSS